MNDLLIAALVIPGCFTVGNIIGWLTVRDKPGRSWNWRVLIGPVLYGKWVDNNAKGGGT